MKHIAIEKAVNEVGSVSWAAVRDVANKIIKRRKVNADMIVSAGKSNDKGVKVYVSKSNVEVAAIIVPHGASNKERAKSVADLLSKLGYNIV